MTLQEAEQNIRHVLSRGEVFDLSMYDLSSEHDIRPIVIETILTYLELLGILESTGLFYSEYKFQPLTSGAEMLGNDQIQALPKRFFSGETKQRGACGIPANDHAGAICADECVSDLVKNLFG